MLALYRAGRQADALAAYQRARAVLDAELGLAPGAELRGLQEAILQQRPGPGGPGTRLDQQSSGDAGPEAGAAPAAGAAHVVPGPRHRRAARRRVAADRAAGHRHRPRRGRQDQPRAGGRPRRRGRFARRRRASCGWPACPTPTRCPRPCWPRWRSGTWPRRPPRTSCSGTSATAPSCSSSTTASTSPTPARCSPSSCSSPARACGCWPPAASRSAARGEVQYAIDPLPVPRRTAPWLT